MTRGYWQAKWYQSGLDGNKPSILNAKEVYDAQMEGYQAYLRNKDLAEQVADEVEERSRERERKRVDGEYLDTLNLYERARYNDTHMDPTPPPPLPPKPVTDSQRAKWIGWAVFLLWLDYEIAASFIGMMARSGARDFQLPSQQVFAFFVYFIVFPGGFFLWPALWLLKDAIFKKLMTNR